MSRKGGGGRCYNNTGFNPTSIGGQAPEHFNNHMEVATFQAYNTTFLDDNGLETRRQDHFPRRPHCRRSIATSHPAAYRALCRDEEAYLEAVEDANEEYVDYPEDRMGGRADAYRPLARHDEYRTLARQEEYRALARQEEYRVLARQEECRGLARQSPVGSSGTVATSCTPASTPSKSSTAASSPRGRPIARQDSAVLAPMLAHLERRLLTRSRSTVLAPHGGALAPSDRQLYSGVRKSLPSLVPVRHVPNPAARLHSFNYMIESETPNRTPRRPNTAVITPNFRSSALPLLDKSEMGLRSSGSSSSPPHDLPQPKPPKSPSTFSKASWATLPTVHLPVETLCCIGFILLLSGAASCILCFYILTLTGRKYFLDFGAISGFTSFILGLLSFRTNKWKWLPHRNYLTGFLMLALFSMVSCGCLAGILYAVLTKNSSIMDTLGGVVCGMCAVVTTGSLLGLVTSGCCHRPPPDNRVAHRVIGFTV